MAEVKVCPGRNLHRLPPLTPFSAMGLPGYDDRLPRPPRIVTHASIAAMTKIRLKVVISELFSQNAFIAHLEGRDDCLIIDPGFDPDAIVEYVNRERLTPAAFLNTHGHADHIAGNEAMKRCWPDVPLLIGAGDADKLTDPDKNLSRRFGLDILSPPADRLLREGDRFAGAGFEFDVYECPGHSIGHIIFVWRANTPTIVFGGDVLFKQSIGRTDIPDGSFAVLERSIRTKLYTLPNDTIVLPGHGPATTIGEEKQHNPFVHE
jgi:hydroxyacylglutathione hydrolase